MSGMWVLTVIGKDRKGLVQSLAEKITAVGGNWEESRMARLAGQFAGVLLVTVDPARSEALVASLRELEAVGLRVDLQPSEAPDAPAAQVHVTVALTAQDRPGIVHDISRVIAARGLNVEELFTEVASAPMSGERMFTAQAQLIGPATTSLVELRKELEALGGELMLDLATDTGD